MSEYTREEILKMIEEVGGPQNLDLSGKDLSGIDLSKKAITKELAEHRKNNPDQTPLWLSDETGGINLKGAILKKSNLTRAHLEGAFLWRTHLEGAILRWAHLREARLLAANLREAILFETDLQEAILIETNLQEARLDMANLQMASLSRANLQKATLHGANLHQAVLSYANLQEASLDGANLQRTSLFSTNLQKATVHGANLQEASLATANLQKATFHGANVQQANLFEAHLEKVDLSVAASLAGACFHEAWLDQTRMTKEQLGSRIGEEVDKKYYEAKEACLLLKNNFNQIGRYDDASWAYIKERQMEKMTYHPKLARKYYAKIEGLPDGASRKSWTWWRFYIKYALKWFWDWIIEALCGYGERPQNVLAVASVVLVIIFPLLYLLSGLAPRSGQSILPWDYFLYSLYSFATMEHPTLQGTCWLAQLFTGLESLTGIALLALLMYTLGRRISRS